MIKLIKKNLTRGVGLSPKSPPPSGYAIELVRTIVGGRVSISMIINDFFFGPLNFKFSNTIDSVYSHFEFPVIEF